MIAVRTIDEAQTPRAHHQPQPGLSTWSTRLFDRETGNGYASATLVEQDPNTLGGAHFHAADQFQVVVRGRGLYGKTEVERYDVHFAAAFSPYGPIRTGDDGLAWFTLRNGPDPGGIKWMPQQREALRAGNRRPRVVFGEPEIPLQPDGLAVWQYVLGAGETRTGASPAAGGGQFWLVLRGTGVVAGRDFQEHSLLYAGPDEAAVDVRAGAAGLEILTLQFPRSH